MAHSFVPDDWELTEKLRDYARNKRLTESTIDDQEEAFRACQFNRVIKCWDRAWMRWVRSAIEWGKVQPIQDVKYRTPQELTDEQRQKDREKFEADMKRLRLVK